MEHLERYVVEELAEDYIERRLTRREFLRRLALITGGMATALSVAQVLGCGTEEDLPPSVATLTSTPAQPTGTAGAGSGINVPPDDPDLEVGMVEFGANGVTLKGYQARPKGSGPFPAVLIVHENRGLTPHFHDVARRFDKQTYVGLALDMLSREGGTDAIGDAQATAIMARASEERLMADMSGAVAYLQGLPFVRGDRIGAIGFCFGGGLVWLLAARNPDLRAAVPYYGPRPPLEEVPNIRAAVFGVYAGNDMRINAAVPELEAALKQNNKTYKIVTYPGADHAFFNDTGGRYNPEAALLAWQETLAWFAQHLRS